LKENNFHPEVSTSNEARRYSLVCSCCGMRQDDDGLIMDCSADHAPALLRTEYPESRFSPHLDRQGLFRYQKWLPVIRAQENVGRSAVYRSKALGNALGLPNLWIAFNGYWPERGALLDTATFKEFEAYTVLSRLPEHQFMLTVASSGNTGAAFAWACSQERRPCLIIVPGKGLRRLKFRAPLHPCVKLVVIDDGEYPDAIDLAAAVCHSPPFQAEGGVKNVGRRDGLATVLLSAFEEMQCLPTHYFQAIGSGTGAVAVLEAAKRLRGAAGDVILPRLMLCQNQPFTPIHDAWRMSSRSLNCASTERLREAVRLVYADELTNWMAPYEIQGGVFDSLMESRGDVLTADNTSARMAINMFLELEGIDVEPAAGVALSCLREAVAQGKVDKDSVVLLNVTGGGRLKLGKDYPLVPAEPQLRLTREWLARGDAVAEIVALCASAAEL
jgi:cysteate synthase